MQAANRRANAAFAADAPLRDALRRFGVANVAKVSNNMYVIVELDFFVSVVIEENDGLVCATHDSLQDDETAIVAVWRRAKGE